MITNQVLSDHKIEISSNSENNIFNFAQEGKYTVLQGFNKNPNPVQVFKIDSYNFHLGKISDLNNPFEKNSYCTKGNRTGKITGYPKQYYYPSTTEGCAGFLGANTEPYTFHIDQGFVYEYILHCKSSDHCKEIEIAILNLKESKEWSVVDCSSGIDDKCEEFSKQYEKIKYTKRKDFFGDFELSHWYNIL
jgi:hypothetical protein